MCDVLLMVGFYAAWEWINISLEYAAGAWARLPGFFRATVCVNLATHPAFTFLLERVGRAWSFILPCELAIWLLEWGLLCLIYRQQPRLRLLAVAATMNATSYVTGLLIA